MGFEKEVKGLATMGSSKAGGSLGSTVHNKFASVDSTAIRFAKYKARFKSGLNSTQKAQYDSIHDTERELFGKSTGFFSPIQNLSLKARLKKEREALRSSLTDDQKLQFTKVNELAAAVIKQEIKFKQFGERLGKYAAKSAIKKM